MEFVEKLHKELTLKPFTEKFKAVLGKYPGFAKMHQMAKVQSGLEPNLKGIDANQMANMANALM